MVDGDGAGRRVVLAVEGARPRARRRVAVVADLDTLAITAEDELAGALLVSRRRPILDVFVVDLPAVAVTLNSGPVRELITVVVAVVIGRSNR